MVCEELEQRLRQAGQEHTDVEAIYALHAAQSCAERNLCISSSAEEKFVSTVIRAGRLAGVLVH
jgi:hypothetical protein